ncbi:MAG: hypothetical protein WD317_05940 [Balneolaceae bacterium]
MSLSGYIIRVRRLDALIRRKSTGTPGELADKLNISERWLYRLLDEIKEELDCPIGYCRKKRSYFYSKKGKIVMGFCNESPAGKSETDPRKRQRQGFREMNGEELKDVYGGTRHIHSAILSCPVQTLREVLTRTI